MAAFRQLMIGLKEVKTKFAIAAESDVMYPPEYFSFVPPQDNLPYRYRNVWLFYGWSGTEKGNYFFKKRCTEGGQIVGRDYWIDRLAYGIRKCNGKVIFPRIGDTYGWGENGNPLISIKTMKGQRLRSKVDNPIVGMESLPMWGTVDKFRKDIWGECKGYGL